MKCVIKFQLITFNIFILPFLSFQSACRPKYRKESKRASNESRCSLMPVKKRHFTVPCVLLVACQSKRSRHCSGPKNGRCILALKPLRRKKTEKRACHFPLMAHWLGPSVTSHGITTKRLCQRDDCGMCVASAARHRSSLAQGSEGEAASPNQRAVTTEGLYEYLQRKQ